jgi:putative FmdB family regulatory protein
VPIYEYRCNECGHQFEVSQRMSDEPVRECEVCGGEVAKMLFAPAIHFKGTGFHNTDYGTRRRGAGEDAGSGGDASSNGASGDAKGGEGKKGSEAAPAASGSSSGSKTVGLDKV